MAASEYMPLELRFWSDPRIDVLSISLGIGYFEAAGMWLRFLSLMYTNGIASFDMGDATIAESLRRRLGFDTDISVFMEACASAGLLERSELHDGVFVSVGMERRLEERERNMERARKAGRASSKAREKGSTN